MGASMKFGRRAAIKAGVGAGVAMLGAPAVGQAQAALKLPLSTVWPDGNFHTINCKRFPDRVKKRPRGAAAAVGVRRGAPLGFRAREQLRAGRDGFGRMANTLNAQQVGDEP